LNCGCPQKWAIGEGIGCHLMSKPDLVKEMVRATKERLAASSARLSDGSPPTCSIKIRIHPDIQQTIEFVRRAEAVGVDWITVHGRTRSMKSTEPVHLDAIKTVSFLRIDHVSHLGALRQICCLLCSPLVYIDQRNRYSPHLRQWRYILS
jgi:tRNA-dihydrouridine synthase